MIVRTRSNRLARLGLVALVAVLAACSDDDAAPATSDAVATAAADTTTPSTPSTPSTTTTTTGSEPSTAPATSEPELREFEGQHVSVIGLWSGPELESFETVRGQWEQVTGAAVDWNGPRDLAGELQDELVQGTEPDVAILPSIGLLHQLAAAGELVPLRTVLDAAQLDADYSPPWLELGSVDGELYGIPYKVTDKSTVWYSPPAFAEAGATVPQTWDELLALADTMVADGRTPFSVVAPKVPGGGGWALTDWVSQLVLAGCGAEQY
ncbi:MAG: extracellular solute-binding protein, partial [Acidimicrobiales bacterium]